MNKSCEFCGERLRPRRNEGPKQFSTRRFCNRGCKGHAQRKPLPDNKTCPRCHKEKPLVEFGIRASTGRPHSYCRPCRGERREEWSEQNPEGQRAIARRKEARRRAYLRDNDWFEYRARFQMPREAGHTAKVLREMWEEQDGRCALTGRALTKQNASIDHIIPIKRGGGHERENLRWVVIEVNRAKRDMLDEEFFAMCRQVAINHGVAYA